MDDVMVQAPEMTLPVGTAKGPGETPQEYRFISPDPEQRLKAGEFVYYQDPRDPANQPIYGRIATREPVRLYPDDFLANPAVAPQQIAELFGYEGDAELFELSVRTLGYFDERLRAFVNPRISPRMGWPIFLATDAMLEQVLSKSRPGEVGAVHVGSLLSRGASVPVVLSGRDFTSTHLAILASTGSGKSYLAAVLIEELMKTNNRAAVLIVDPHAEYGTLTEMAQHPAFAGSDSYTPIARVYQPKEVNVRFSSLRPGDLRGLMDLSERMNYLLERALREIHQHKSSSMASLDNWTSEDLIREIKQYAVRKKDEDEAVDLSTSAAALEWRIEQLVKDSKVIHETHQMELKRLFQPGQCTVLQLDEVSLREQQVAVAVLLRQLWRARQETENGHATRGKDNYLPYPVFVLLEEAHHFAPGGEGASRVVSAEILRTILSEGRKFGVGIGLISQRPGKLDQDVLSQCMTQILMRIVNPIDQNNVAASVEGASRDVLDELPALSKGQAIVVGASVNAPVVVSVRTRHTTHGGQDQDAPRLWVEYSNPTRKAERDRDEAPLVQPTSDNPLFLPERNGKANGGPRKDLTFEDFFGPDRQ